MNKNTINNVQIQVRTIFREDISNVEHGSFLYNYYISIQNLGSNPLKLLRRYWKIEHLNHGSSIVSGDGVIGEQPILQQFQTFEYVSGSQIIVPFGRMSGFYTFQDLVTGEQFPVEIPCFQLVYPALLN
jgi:ApaG protein